MNKKLLVVGAGLEQTLVLKQAKKMQLVTVAVDANPNAVGAREADFFVCGDIQNHKFLVETYLSYRCDGLICHAVDIPVTIAQAASVLNLPGPSVEVVHRANDKIARLNHLKTHNINCANFSEINSLPDLHKFWDKKNTDAIILKPIDNSGSRGVIKIMNPSDIESAYKYASTYSQTRCLLAEELLQGPELSTESIVVNGSVYTFALADRNYANSSQFSPYFVEDGINYPSKLSSSLINDVQRLVADTIHALEIDNGVAKGDILIYQNVPYIIEMAPRSSGGWFGAGSMTLATGVDYIEILIKMALQEEISESECIPSIARPCAQRYLISQKSGTVSSISYPSALNSYKNVKMMDLFLPNEGDTVVKAQNHTHRFAHVICTGDTLDEAILSCENVIDSIKICLEE
jgi:biotin carboxylase